MADYYPLLVRAIGGLAQNTGEARKVVYDRARAALLKQLRSVEPPLPEGEIGRERQALEEAIRRIEAQYPAAPEPQEPEVREPPAPAGKTPEPAPQPAEPEAPVAVNPDALGPEEAVAATARRPILGRGHVGERHERPRIARDEPRRPRWQRTAAIVGLIALLIGGGAYVLVSSGTFFTAPQRQAGPSPASPAADPQKGADQQPKSTDRVTQAGGDRSAPAAPQRPANATTLRAYLFEEAAGTGQSGVQTYEGTVTWKTETFNAGPGLPPDVGIRADLQIPGRMSVSFTLRRNADQALPASHTIEIGFTLPQDFAYGGITNVPGVLMKQTEGAQGAPLVGLSVRVNPTYFLVGLSAVPVDKDRNLQLLQSRPWIGFPMAFSNNKRAAIAFEKGGPGEQAFKDAFSAWGELLPQTPPPMPATPPGGG